MINSSDTCLNTVYSNEHFNKFSYPVFYPIQQNQENLTVPLPHFILIATILE